MKRARCACTYLRRGQTQDRFATLLSFTPAPLAGAGVRRVTAQLRLMGTHPLAQLLYRFDTTLAKK